LVKEILILGNGISRLPFDMDIRKWPGTLWGCNRVYLDFGKEIHGLYGHCEVMREAERYRDAHGLHFEILGTSENPFICRDLFRKDTGTTLVSEALTRGMRVNVVGFDLGGLDIYSPGHEKKNKTTWVNRWRLILREFGPDNVIFWGYDHKPFLLSHRNPSEYAREYMHGKPHIDNDQYDRITKAWANDYSRVYGLIPHVLLRNIGQRVWHFSECKTVIDSGNAESMPECVAEKYAQLYPSDFRIEPLPKEASGSMIKVEG
jgi:hypothetical protein